MDYYHIWADHKKEYTATEFANGIHLFLSHLKTLNKIDSYNVTRMKLGFRSLDLPEFHIIMKFNNLQQLDDAMTAILENQEDVDTTHTNFNHMVDVETIQHALYRDYPDEQS